jgi:hypothetical protein
VTLQPAPRDAILGNDQSPEKLGGNSVLRDGLRIPEHMRPYLRYLQTDT